MRYFKTVSEARNAAALDTGFDRWNVYGGRCTKSSLAELGYIVDPLEARRQRGEVFPDVRCDLFSWREDCGLSAGDSCDWDVTAAAYYPGAEEWLAKNPFGVGNPYVFEIATVRVHAREKSQALSMAIPQLREKMAAARKKSLREMMGR